ncbi:uncharacterized protein LOC135366113 [Ornithodoros turicata]|uniref:uncharacterized protein LOC135366113 n=1 Tax=Ornithodoros turicata TaxID=34597 RepID=UPI003138E0CD
MTTKIIWICFAAAVAISVEAMPPNDPSQSSAEYYFFRYKSTNPLNGSHTANATGQHFHEEISDSDNVRSGSYGYVDANGIERRVDYVADASGFRAVVRATDTGPFGKDSNVYRYITHNTEFPKPKNFPQ